MTPREKAALDAWIAAESWEAYLIRQAEEQAEGREDDGEPDVTPNIWVPGEGWVVI